MIDNCIEIRKADRAMIDFFPARYLLNPTFSPFSQVGKIERNDT